MGIKGSTKQRRADCISKHSPFFGLKFKTCVVRAYGHFLATAHEFKRPGARRDTCFKLELASQPWTDGTDAFDRSVTLAFVRDHGRFKPTNGNGGFVHHIDHDHDDVLIVVVNLHGHRGQVRMERAGSGAVVVTHPCSPVVTGGQLYFNGLLESVGF